MYSKLPRSFGLSNETSTVALSPLVPKLNVGQKSSSTPYIPRSAPSGQGAGKGRARGGQGRGRRAAGGKERVERFPVFGRTKDQGPRTRQDAGRAPFHADSPWKENHMLTRKGWSRDAMISTSRRTLRRASLSMHWPLFMYFMAYIWPLSFFSTMHTCGFENKENFKQDFYYIYDLFCCCCLPFT